MEPGTAAWHNLQCMVAEEAHAAVFYLAGSAHHCQNCTVVHPLAALSVITDSPKWVLSIKVCMPFRASNPLRCSIKRFGRGKHIKARAQRPQFLLPSTHQKEEENAICQIGTANNQNRKGEGKDCIVPTYGRDQLSRPTLGRPAEEGAN